MAAFRYEFPVDGLLRALKYRGRLPVARALGFACAVELAPRLRKRPDIVVPVPLHWRRYLTRGFNQSHELARPLSSALALPLCTNLVRRTRYTKDQASLPSARRRANVRGAFATDAALTGKTVAIFDDVMTTGETLASVTHCMHRAGAAEVQVWVCARAFRK